MNEQFINIFMQMTTLFLIVGIGYVAKKTKVFTPALDKDLSRLIITVAVPALILASVLNSDTVPTIDQLVTTGGLAIGSSIFAIVFAFLLTFALRISPGHQGVFRYMIVFGNVGFIGFPVTQAIFGTDALVYASVFQLPFNLLVYTLGVWFVAQDNEVGVKVKLSLKQFLSPAVIACLATIAFSVAGIHAVPVLGPSLETLGALTTPASLLIIGSSLANLPVKQLVGGPRLWIACFVRLIVVPLLMWLLFSQFVSDPVLLGVTVVLAGMPVATNGTMLCYQYGGDTKTMAQGTAITTLFSLITIPILMMLIGG